jgi:phospholipid-binding lipoprotein MlaA
VRRHPVEVILAGRTPVVRLIAVGFALIALSACATRPPADDPIAVAQYKSADDPVEPLNRGVYKFNNGFNTVVLNPISTVYTTIFPKILRDRLRSFLDNLDSPLIFINDVLQGRGKRASDTLGRFALNSTVGIGGLFDPAADLGIPKHSEDFGQTLAAWGVIDGGYMMIPIYGPSSARDGLGLIVDLLMDPVTWIFKANNVGYLSWPRLGASGLDNYSRNRDLLTDLRKNSVDGYVTLRTYYRQNRDFEIRNGEAASKEDQQDQNDLFDDFGGEDQ